MTASATPAGGQQDEHAISLWNLHKSLSRLADELAEAARETEIRAGNDKEFAATTVLRIALAEAACKVRTGPPDDDAEDMHIAAWAGVLPLAEARGTPVPDAHCTAPAPGYVRGWTTDCATS